MKRVLKLAATDVGKTAQARAYAEAGRRFGKDLTSRQLIAAILDVRTKNLDHFKNSSEKVKAKAALKAAYIAWGKQAHSFSSALLQSHLTSSAPSSSRALVQQRRRRQRNRRSRMC